MSPVFLEIILPPAAVASVSAFVLARNVRRIAAVAAFGPVLAAVFALVAYLSAPTAHAPHGCSDCGLYLGRWKTRVELANAIFEYIEVFHNRRRRHSSLGMLTPIEFELNSINTTAEAA